MERTNAIVTTEPADIIIVIVNTIDVHANRTKLTGRDFAFLSVFIKPYSCSIERINN